MADKNDISSALYKAADRRTRQYGVRAGLLLALALFAAVGSALLLTRYMETRTAEARVPTSAVVVADKDLAVGTELRGDQLRVVAWPIASLPEGALTNPKDLEGKVVAVRLYKGEPILPPKLSGGDAGSLSALLPVGMRAAAVRVDDVVGVAGFIHPGDIVDVIATVRQEGSNSQTSSKIILQAIKVLAVGKELDHRSKGTDKVVPATVATLMVDAEESGRPGQDPPHPAQQFGHVARRDEGRHPQFAARGGFGRAARSAAQADAEGEPYAPPRRRQGSRCRASAEAQRSRRDHAW